MNRKAAGRVASGHPWIFSSDVEERGEAAPGEAVRVAAPNDRLLGTAHYSSSSQITLRMLAAGVVDTDRDFFRNRIARALNYRRAFLQDMTVCRLVHAEADFLPALIIDRYGDYFTIQALNQGMDRATPQIVEALVDLFAPAGIIARNDAAVRSLENLPREVKVLHGEVPDSICIPMNGLQFHADLAHGQKTGIFLDQSENYRAAAQYGHGRALDCFTSTGGFALHLATSCEEVEAIDSSGPALALAQRNAEANGLTNVEFREADAFDALASMKRRFDVIVLDPPAFAKSRQQKEAALRAYKQINLRALKLLEPGGTLVSCSCSHHISEAELLGAVAEASLDTGRVLRVLERRMQSRDHPVLLTVPETLYLKCLIFRVD